VLMPVAYYPVYRVTAVDPSWSAFWSHWIALPFWPSGPMWFLWLLLVFNVAAAGLYWLAPRAGEALGELSAKAGSHPGRFFIALVSVLALAYLPLAAVFEPWQWMQFGPFAFQPSLAPQYVIYFFAGLGVGAYGFDQGLLEGDGVLARRWARWLVGTAAAFLLWVVPTALIVHGTLVPGERVSRAGGGLLALCGAATAGIRKPGGQRLRHLSRPLRLRDLAAIHVAPRASVRRREGRDCIHGRADAELGDERRHLPASDRRPPDGPQPARIGESALTCQRKLGSSGKPVSSWVRLLRRRGRQRLNLRPWSTALSAANRKRFIRRQANISEPLPDNRECPPNKVPGFFPCSCVASFVR